MAIEYIPRVTQLDAVFLDDQLVELFKQQLFEATKYIKPGLLQSVLPELELLLRTWIFKYSIVDKKSTFGQNMLSIGYKTENFSTSKLYWYYGYSVGLKYFRERAMYSFISNRKVQNIMSSLETFQLIGDIFNFLRFILNGKHPTLIDFILGLEISAEKIIREDLTDFAWTRELLWNNLIELMGTIIALMNIFGLKAKISALLKYAWWRKPPHLSVCNTSPKMDENTLCVFCSASPILPHTMGCSHIFCYYCLVASKMADENFSCPKCYFNGKEILPFVMS